MADEMIALLDMASSAQAFAPQMAERGSGKEE
jgi:hypothetical protein